MMRRVLCAGLLALLALAPPLEAYLPTALSFTEGSAHTVTSATGGAGAQQGTVMMLLRPTSTAAALRHLFTETGGSGMSAFRRAADGTSVRLQVFRGAGTPQQVDSPTGMLVVGRRIRLVLQWDIAGNPALYYAYDGNRLVNASTTPAAGSGAHSTTAQVWTVGSATAAGMVVWEFGVSEAVLSVEEMEAFFRHPDRRFRSSRVAWVLGSNSTQLTRDLTGNAMHGTVSGPTMTNDGAPGVFFRRGF